MSSITNVRSVSPSDSNVEESNYRVITPIRNGFKYVKDFFKDLFVRTLSYFWAERKSKPALLLFIGLKGSGKTTAIKHLGSSLVNGSSNLAEEPELFDFDVVENENGPKYNLEHQECSFQRWSFDHEGTPIDLVEAPCFRSSYDVTYNARMISAMYHFLERFSDTSIPTMVVVTVRLNEQRFQGESSEFSHLLKYLKYLGNRISDSNWSNVVLLLTHVDRPEIRGEVDQRVGAFKSQFKLILGVEPNCITTGISGSKISANQIDILGKRNEIADNNSSTSGQEVGIGRVTFKGQDDTQVDSLNINVPNSLVDLINSDNIRTDIFKATSSIITFVDSSINFQTLCHEKGYIDAQEIKTKYNLDLSRNKIYNVIDARSQILLSDGVPILVSDCFVGHRVMSHNAIGVITKLVKIICRGYSSDTNIANVPISISEVYQGVKQGSVSRYIQLSPHSDTYKLVPVKPVFMAKFSNREAVLMYVEVDGGSGTFVANGYVRKCSVENDNNNLFI